MKFGGSGSWKSTRLPDIAAFRTGVTGALDEYPSNGDSIGETYEGACGGVLGDGMRIVFGLSNWSCLLSGAPYRITSWYRAKGEIIGLNWIGKTPMQHIAIKSRAAEDQPSRGRALRTFDCTAGPKIT
jgi:hypothetical protein